MIQFQCPHCGHPLKAPAATAGKSGKCNKCNSKIRVPSPNPNAKAVAIPQVTQEPQGGPKHSSTAHSPSPKKSETAKSARTTSQAKVLDLVSLCLTLVALMMVMMPLLYCGLIATACYGMFWYWTEILPGLMNNLPRGRALVFAMMAYISPLIGGGIMILFMIKPIFFSFVLPRDTRQRSLKRASEPVLFELVDRICESTRSPTPKRIDINNDVNASASLRRGFLSLFGKDLVLTIGAPLIAGMNTRQLTGVLAHEFGHFAQGGGMKATYVVLTVNHWFARVVYQRDLLDEMLDEGIAESDFRISLVLMFAKLFVLLSRAVLWCFLMLTHAISCLMTRQMEYDADRYEAYVSGSDCFESTSKRLVELVAGQQAAHGVISSALQREVLLGDLPQITAIQADSVSAKERKRIMLLSEMGTSGFFSTHPPTDKRVKAAKKFGANGLFQLEVPARKLFKNFDAICNGVSADFYRNELGILVDQSKLARHREPSEPEAP